MVPAKSVEIPRAYVFALWTLLGLFCLRVSGQFLVAFFAVSFLPPMNEWYSGVMAYPWLLLSQVIIIFAYGRVCLDFSRGRGFFVIARRALGKPLLVFGSLYFGIMVIRYVIRMSLYAPERWTGGSIPIFFHWVLALFILTVGSYHWRQTRSGTPENSSPPARGRFRARAIRASSITLVAGGLVVWILFQLGPSIFAQILGSRPAEFAVRGEKAVEMTTSDGVALVSQVFRPQRTESAPTILVRMPLPWTLTNRLFTNVVGRMWAERGYNVVMQQTRGSFPSGGEHYPLRDERSDGIETLDWIADQPWFDGRIGLWGGSYFGYTQWVLADQIDPGPSALFVQVCSTDWYRMLYPGGAFSLESALYWSVWIDWEYVEKPSPEFLDTGYVGFPLVESDDRTGQDIGFFNEMALHTDRDRFWMEIDGENRAESLVAPALLMAGWYDPFLPTMLDDYKRIRLGAEPHVAAATRLTIGPWAHARAVELPEGFLPRNYRIESLAPALPWYDLQFRAEAGQDDGALPVRIFVMGRNEWREEEAWPLARAIDTNYYLRSDGNANSASGDGALSLSPPGAEEPPDTYTYDPRKPVPTAGGAMFGSRAGAALQENVESRPDVLVYTTPPLQEDLEVTGPIKLILNVSTTALSTDFTGKLVDVYPDGSAYNISDGILRRDYDPRAEDSVDSRTEEIAIDLWPTSIVFFKGHRIRLQVSSSNYPRFDRNPNTRGNIPTETDPIVANQKVHHAPNTLSRLILPVIPR